jgi:hypothetical protein
MGAFSGARLSLIRDCPISSQQIKTYPLDQSTTRLLAEAYFVECLYDNSISYAGGAKYVNQATAFGIFLIIICDILDPMDSINVWSLPIWVDKLGRQFLDKYANDAWNTGITGSCYIGHHRNLQAGWERRYSAAVGTLAIVEGKYYLVVRWILLVVAAELNRGVIVTTRSCSGGCSSSCLLSD